ncbi:SPOSA6832_01806, partial [Sporobolomyces salmonicolor]
MASTHTVDVTGPHAAKFYTKQWHPPAGQPVIAQLCFVHGFIEHIDRYSHVFPRFASAGIAVYAFDQRGFGKTATYTPKHSQGITSWPLQLGDLEFFIQEARKAHEGVPLYLFGHSMGGGLALAYPTRSPPSPSVALLSGVIASSPLLRQAPAVKAPGIIVKAGSLLGRLSATLPIKATVKAEVSWSRSPGSVPRKRTPAAIPKYKEPTLPIPSASKSAPIEAWPTGESLVTKDYKHWPKGLPLLVVHGEGDKVTDHQASKLFIRNLEKLGTTDASYEGFPGFFSAELTCSINWRQHEMHNEPGDDKWREINFIIDWIVTRAQSVTSSSLPAAAAVPAAREAEAPDAAPDAAVSEVAASHEISVDGGEIPSAPVGMALGETAEEARASKL